jgi:hypothetical protein
MKNKLYFIIYFLYEKKKYVNKISNKNPEIENTNNKYSNNVLFLILEK